MASQFSSEELEEIRAQFDQVRNLLCALVGFLGYMYASFHGYMDLPLVRMSDTTLYL